MNQPQSIFNYKGYHVEIDLKAVGDRWHSSYRIGDSCPNELDETRESSQARALLYASNDARGRIDRMS